MARRSRGKPQPLAPVPIAPLTSPPNAIVRPSVVQPQQVVVTSEGENVVVQIGNSTLRIHYVSALKLSQWIRVRAKEVKRRIGDTSRHWSTLAILEDFKG